MYRYTFSFGFRAAGLAEAARIVPLSRDVGRGAAYGKVDHGPASSRRSGMFVGGVRVICMNTHVHACTYFFDACIYLLIYTVCLLLPGASGWSGSPRR